MTLLMSLYTGVTRANSGDSKLLSLISSIIFINLLYYSRVRTVQPAGYWLKDSKYIRNGT